MSNEEIIAKQLLKIKVILFNTKQMFTWASGIKSPIYCDNRLILSHPKSRDIVENALARLVKKHYPTAQVIAGTSTAGIAHAAYVSKILNLPMVYVRTKPKDHGTGKLIEGEIKPNQKVVVIEDLLSTGISCLQVVNILRRVEANVLGVGAIFSYNMQRCQINFKRNKTKYHALSNLDILVNTAVKTKHINESEREIILEFRDGLN